MRFINSLASGMAFAVGEIDYLLLHVAKALSARGNFQRHAR